MMLNVGRWPLVPVSILTYLWASLPSAAAAPPKRPTAPVKTPPVKAAPVPPPPPASPAPESGITTLNLAPTLRALGYMPIPADGYQRLRVEEDHYSYFMDLQVTPTGDWVAVMAHLATVPDLTKVPAPPLLALLSENDKLLGMAFSYNAANGRLMLNATVPARTLTAKSLQVVIEGLRATVKRTDGLWDASQW